MAGDMLRIELVVVGQAVGEALEGDQIGKLIWHCHRRPVNTDQGEEAGQIARGKRPVDQLGTALDNDLNLVVKPHLHGQATVARGRNRGPDGIAHGGTGQRRIDARLYGAKGTVWFDDVLLVEGIAVRQQVFARKYGSSGKCVLPIASADCGSWLRMSCDLRT